jgi:hypothetical protein
VGDTVDGIAAQSKVNDAMTFTVSDFLGAGMNDGNIEEVRNHESDESDEWKKGDWRLGVYCFDHFFGFVRFVRFVVPQIFLKEKIGSRYSCPLFSETANLGFSNE